MKTALRFVSSIAALVLTATFAAPLQAAPTLHLETDPATFAFRGFAAHARLVPEQSHWSIGVGVYALDFPDLLVDTNPENKDEGWDVRLDLGVGVFVDYYLRPEPDGWFFGAHIAAQRFQYERERFEDSADGTNGLLMVRAGYTWFPFDAGLYLMPWFGVGVTAPLGGNRAVGGEKYDVFPLIPYGALHAGWRL